MRILVTNDDGIHAPGLKLLEGIAAELSDDVWVVAPETDQSGVSHSLSLNDPLRLREIDERRFAVKGTPTDCVIMGVRHVIREAAARPRAVRRQPRPERRRGRDLFGHGRRRHGGHHPRRALDRALPGLRPRRAQRHQVALRRDARAGDRAQDARRRHPEGHPRQRELPRLRARRGARHRGDRARGSATRSSCASTSASTGAATLISGSPSPAASTSPANGTDLWAIADRRISVTPLRLDLTDEPTLTRYAQAFE